MHEGAAVQKRGTVFARFLIPPNLDQRNLRTPRLCVHYSWLIVFPEFRAVSIGKSSGSTDPVNQAKWVRAVRGMGNRLT